MFFPVADVVLFHRIDTLTEGGSAIRGEVQPDLDGRMANRSAQSLAEFRVMRACIRFRRAVGLGRGPKRDNE